MNNPTFSPGAEPALDVAIIGAGLCGLRLAGLLRAAGRRPVIFEARTRLGGRVLSVGDAALDLGPTWFWPDTQPRILRLLDELGLRHFAQHDDGRVLRLDDPNRAPDEQPFPGLHGGARRLAGGMKRLIEVLAQSLPADRVRLGHRLLAVAAHQDGVELRLDKAGGEITVRARQLVLALPPRVVETTVQFTPELAPELRAALRATPTWMATAAKAAMAYGESFWRGASHSGNAFVTHPQAVLCEVFDACDEAAGSAALAGFVELAPAQRQLFRVGLPLMIRSQLAQLYGPAAESGELHLQDWADEPLSCSALDRETPLKQLPAYGDARLAVPYWSGRLHFGGSETAGSGGGYLEGALEAATRIAARVLSDQRSPAPSPRLDPDNEACLGRFRDWVQAQRASAFERYRGELQRALAQQRSEQLTRRALLAAVDAVYAAALQQLSALRFDTRTLVVERGRSALTPALLAPFIGFSDALLDEAVRFNRSSCALSNFPFEHAPDADYLQVIRRDLAAAWRQFALSANEGLLPAAATQPA